MAQFCFRIVTKPLNNVPSSVVSPAWEKSVVLSWEVHTTVVVNIVPRPTVAEDAQKILTTYQPVQSPLHGIRYDVSLPLSSEGSVLELSALVSTCFQFEEKQRQWGDDQMNVDMQFVTKEMEGADFGIWEGRG